MMNRNTGTAWALTFALANGCSGTTGTAPAAEAAQPTTTEGAEAPDTQAAPELSASEKALNHHLGAFMAKDLDTLVAQYAETATIQSPMGTFQGPAAIRTLYEGLFKDFTDPATQLKPGQVVVEGNIGYATWTAETANATYHLGTDTFIFDGNTILQQTVAVHITPKAADAKPPAMGTMPADDAKPTPTEEVMGRHLAAFGSGNMEAILLDYADDAFLITPMGTLKGKEALKGLFAGMFAEFSKDPKFNLTLMTSAGDTGYIYWNGENATNAYPMGTDTFLVKDGKIIAQTFAGVITPKPAPAPAAASAAPAPPAAK